MLSRRDFLQTGSLSVGAMGLSLASWTQAALSRDTSCILLMLVGGPSQLDTWDLKPNAPSHVRGPFRPIATNVPGIQISECFPRMAKLANHYALVRSVYHDAAPIHETGHQLLQTGHLSRFGKEYPNCGSVLSFLHGQRTLAPAFAIVPGPINSTGVHIGHGQTAAFLGEPHAPRFLAPDRELYHEPMHVRDRYGRHRFGESCLLARRLIEAGTRFVTVNMFDTVFNQVTWDCHADQGSLASDLLDYREILCPMFDQAYSALLEDLHQRGRLTNTLVVAMGEFGRTPHLNPRGGRDHWPGVWSVVLAGGGIRGGQVIGSSDALGGEPNNRPVRAEQLAATIYYALGIGPSTRLPGCEEPLVDAQPITELFGCSILHDGLSG